jgi:hypothetical protein
VCGVILFKICPYIVIYLDRVWMEESNSFICESLETAPNGILLPESETFQFVFSLAKLETETLWFRIESFQIL